MEEYCLLRSQKEVEYSLIVLFKRLSTFVAWTLTYALPLEDKPSRWSDDRVRALSSV